MKNIFLPTKVEYKQDVKNKNIGTVIIEPCYPGYGITWGNTLRRVLLTSLQGAAVTAIKIKGVKYEFSTIDYILEDVLEIILNLKLLRLKILKDSDTPIKLSIKVNGEKKVLAKDIKKLADVEIVNPDLLIATLTDKKAKLEMDIWVEKGCGWISSEEKSRQGLEIGTIVTDSIFNPVLNISVNVENMRVGKRTDYDKLILNIETDGTISPIDAFIQSSNLLTGQFGFFVELVDSISKPKAKPKKTVKKKTKPKAKPKKTVKKKTKSKAKPKK